MRVGRYLRELWGMKPGLAVAVVIALLAATRVFYSISVFPPGIEREPGDLSSASTRVLVDTPRSALVDLRQSTYDLTSLTNRSVLVGNVMASPEVREFIARQVGTPARQIAVIPPLTPDQPRPPVGSEYGASITDLVKSPGQLRLAVEADPASPILDVHAEASDPAVARELAEAAVIGTKDYLDARADAEHTPASSRVRVSQLGPASSDVVNPGAQGAVAVLVFLIAFGLTCVVVLFVARIRQGWSKQDEVERPPATGAA
jgi:hypothetical protein